MFRQMRRPRQQLPQSEVEAALHAATSGVLALLGDEDYPYAVPLSYVYADGKILFHCAKSGHKLDAVRNHNKVSFCVTAQDQVVPEKYTTYFRSVIVFGRIRELEGEEKRNALRMLGRRYHPADTAENLNATVEQHLTVTCVLELAAEHMTGKEAKELMQRRKVES